MDAYPLADQSPVVPLRITGVAQAREPFQRGRNIPAICKYQAQRLIDECDINRMRVKLDC